MALKLFSSHQTRHKSHRIQRICHSSAKARPCHSHSHHSQPGVVRPALEALRDFLSLQAWNGTMDTVIYGFVVSGTTIC